MDRIVGLADNTDLSIRNLCKQRLSYPLQELDDPRDFHLYILRIRRFS